LAIFTQKILSLRQYLTEQGFTRIPLKKLQTGHYKLKMHINGTVGEFILDTGASSSCVGYSYTLHFDLTSEESELKAAGAGSRELETRLSPKNDLVIGDIKHSKVDLVLFDLGTINHALAQVDEPMVHGIFGADLLKRFRAVIDYGRNALYLKAGKTGK
jgi:predicted aspartyl protease